MTLELLYGNELIVNAIKLLIVFFKSHLEVDINGGGLRWQQIKFTIEMSQNNRLIEIYLIKMY